MPLTITLEDDEALVLFEFLNREVDERKGENLSPALVSEAEFWALNAALCLLEKTMVGGPAPYADAVRQARVRLAPAPEDTEFRIACTGTESPAMAVKG